MANNLTTGDAKKTRGAWAEDLVAQHLAAAGLTILARNHRIRGGELDLVAQTQNAVVVFVEVKQRATTSHGGASVAITPRKVQLLRRAALDFLMQRFGHDNVFCRFDAVLVHGTPRAHRVEWLEDVF